MKWMRLDIDWYADPKFLALVREKGKGAGYNAIVVLTLATKHEGRIDLSNALEIAELENALGIKGKRLRTFLETLSTYNLILPEELTRDVVTSKRLRDEAETAQSYIEQKRNASRKRWEKKHASA